MSNEPTTPPTKSGHYWVRALDSQEWHTCYWYEDLECAYLAGTEAECLDLIAEWGPRIPTPDENREPKPAPPS